MVNNRVPSVFSKTYVTPRRPFEKARLDQELKIIGEYGLRNKREVWRVKYTLARIRKAARELLTLEEKDPKRLFEAFAFNVQPHERGFPIATGVFRLNKQLDHLPEHCEITERTKKQVRYKRGRCARCVAQQRRTKYSNILCSQCQVFLCVGQCWKEYHTLETLS